MKLADCKRIDSEGFNPFLRVDRDYAKKLVRYWDINLEFLKMLRDRAIVYESIPPSFLTMMADELCLPAEALEHHFRSKPKPGVQVNTFSFAVVNCATMSRGKRYSLILRCKAENKMFILEK